MTRALATYIRDTRSLGFSDQEILHALIGAGWADYFLATVLQEPMASSDVIRTEGVAKKYPSPGGDTIALNDISLAIRKGESVAVVGKSGSGKSTLMHILATLDQPTQGAVYINGQSTADLKSDAIDTLRNKTFGFVFQQFFLNGRNTCLENAMLPLAIRGAFSSERIARAQAALAAVGLSDKAAVRASNLSGGQKQRLCIARALVTEPDVIFADEPTGNLDSENGRIVTDLLFRLQKERGLTLIVVTHDPDLAALCDRTITIRDGMLSDTPYAHS